MAYNNGFLLWDDEFERAHFTPEEIADTHFRASIVTSIINARHEKGISQRQLGEMTGIKQPVIARIESGRSVPKIDTLQKVLLALGKTLTITDVAPAATQAKTQTPAALERSR